MYPSDVAIGRTKCRLYLLEHLGQLESGGLSFMARLASSYSHHLATQAVSLTLY